MGKALYRKYRSRSLDEIVGQEHITTTLSNALKQGKIAHAYLLTGPRGVGKTSIARILAHQINDLPYSEEPNLDIIEIDAASNNGVEDVRDLRDKIPSAPVGAKYKVFIIDEVHMLSKAAFNALLKTLEEPPAHVIFILATTEAHKLPDTIISRTQRFSFRPVSELKVVEHLKTIANNEKISIDDDALQLIAMHGEGSFRDSISLLDQVSSTRGRIRRTDIEQLLGHVPTALIEELLAQVSANNMSGCVETLEALTNQGYEPAMIALQLGQALRKRLLAAGAGSDLSNTKILDIARDLLDVPGANNPHALLEIIILKHAADNQEADLPYPTSNPAPKTVVKPITAAPEVNTPIHPVAEPVETIAKPTPLADLPEVTTSYSPSVETPQSKAIDQVVAELWQEALQTIKKSHNTLYGIARMARPSLDDDTLTLELTFSFHQKRLNEPRNKEILSSIMEQIRHAPTQVVCVLTTKQSNIPSPSVSDNVTTISNIFGGAELLES
jgi:DNA polymerase-3 subunit gamma/tau